MPPPVSGGQRRCSSRSVDCIRDAQQISSRLAMPPISGGAEVQTTSTGWRGIEASLSLVFATAGYPDGRGARAFDGAERIRAPRAMVGDPVGRTARLGRAARRDVALDRVALSHRP